MPLTYFHDALAAIGLPQDADLLFCRVSFAFRSLGPFYRPQTNIASGLDFGGSPQLLWPWGPKVICASENTRV